MNHYAAQQREFDGRWDYTITNDKHVRPVGYCRGYVEFTAEDGSHMGMTPAQIEEYNNDLRGRKDKYHTGGHETKEEACACYRQYLLDIRLRFVEDDPAADTQHKCVECEAWTSGSAEIREDCWYLCKEHRTREIAEKLMPPVGESWSSY